MAGKPAYEELELRVKELEKKLIECNRAEEALRESEDRARFLANLLECSSQPLAVGYPDGRLMTYNTAYCKLLGYSKEELDKVQWLTDLTPPEWRDVVATVAEEISRTGQPQRFEKEYIRKDGSRVPVEVLAHPSFDSEGNLQYYYSFFTDITDRKQLEQQFLQAQKMEAMGTLAGGVAHDFNNLLTAIQGNASLMLLDSDTDHPFYERLKNIEHSVKSGAELTRQLLGFARGGRYELMPTDLNELMRSSSDMFGRTKKQITIHTKYQEGIWPVEVDKGQIEQVMLNLYVNAWQAMPAGGELYLETENVTLDEGSVRPYHREPGRYVKISITDTGIGMDKATRQRIFEPFFTTKGMGRGTGLGLASVHGIITNHTGIITVDSTQGKGTTFTIYLPASEREVVTERHLPGEILRGSERVLLVDDEEAVLDVGEQILQALGYEVVAASSGRQAIEVYEKNPDTIHMVILDMIMPEMGGGETYDRLRQINPAIKVLLASGYSIDGQPAEILGRGCDGFIQKPFNMKELSQRIREVLDKK